MTYYINECIRYFKSTKSFIADSKYLFYPSAILLSFNMLEEYFSEEWYLKNKIELPFSNVYFLLYDNKKKILLRGNNSDRHYDKAHKRWIIWCLSKMIDDVIDCFQINTILMDICVHFYVHCYSYVEITKHIWKQYSEINIDSAEGMLTRGVW